MKILSRTIILGGVLLIASMGAATAETRIDCPLKQAKRKIVGDFGKTWWTTPVVDSLSQTKVMNIGGKPALMCIYGNAGSIQRNAPAGASCRAVTGGFVCSGGAASPVTQSQQQAPSVQVQPQQPQQPQQQQQAAASTFSTGKMSVRQTYTFDIDRGVVGQGAAADVWFEAKTAKDLFLTPRNGARMSVSGKRNRGFAGCSKARYSAGNLPLAKLPVGTYICVRTNEGRVGEFRINGITGGSPKTLTLGYTTWN